MTITVSPDFKTLTITSVHINEDSTSGSFKWTLNCEETQHTLDISDKLVDNDGTITIEAGELFSGKSIFSDGVYSIELELNGLGSVTVDDIEVLVEGIYTLTYCLFIGSTSNCKALRIYEASGDETIEYIIKALQLLNDCDCDCSQACDLYDALIYKINNYTENDNNTNCGCS